jgi:predicted metalloprotease with PDZ domain
LKQDKNVKTQWALFEQSKEICSLLLYIVHRDVSSVDQSWPSLPRGMPQSTCGIMLNGTRVDNVLVGGPACSLGIERGDIITEIDGMAVTPENVHDHLLGDDIPGHCVEISVQKHDNGPVQRYSIERTPTVTILDRRRLLEQLTGLNTQPPLAARIIPALRRVQAAD